MNPLFHTDLSISDSLKNVRKSVLIYETIILCYAVNRQDVLDMIADGKETIIGSSMFPAFEKYYMPELADKYSQDTAKAKELLAEVGFPDGFDMTITVPSNYQ